MLVGACRKINFQGRPAFLFVLRNNGECWGRLVVAGSEEFDVPTLRDHYEHDDEIALRAFERAVRRGKVERAVGWLKCSGPVGLDQERHSEMRNPGARAPGA